RPENCRRACRVCRAPWRGHRSVLASFHLRACPARPTDVAAVHAIQFLVIYGLFALAGLRLARARNRATAPRLSAIFAKKRPGRLVLAAAGAVGPGRLLDHSR